MNYFLKKRVQSGLTRSDMARELGIDYQRYVAIEKGSVKMPLNLMDKFNKIIYKGKENEITKVENNRKADEFWNEVKQRTDDGKYVLTQKMREFNIPNINVLVGLLGYKSASTVWNYLEGRNPVGIEFKKRLYNFFSDELNIQIPTKIVGSQKNGVKRMREQTVNKELDNYYQNTDFKKILRDNQITNTQIGAAIGMHCSVVSRMTSKTAKPSYRTIQKVKDYLDAVINDDHVVDVVALKEEPITNDSKERKFEYKYSKKQLSFFNKFNLMNWLKEQELTPTEFANMCGLSEGTLYNFDSYKKTDKKPTSKTIDIIRKAVEARESKQEVPSKKDSVQYISKQKLIDECQKEIDINNAKIEELTNQIKELQSKNELSIKFIALVNALQ